MAKYTITVKTDNYYGDTVEVPDYMTATVARAIVRMDSAERNMARMLSGIEAGDYLG